MQFSCQIRSLCWCQGQKSKSKCRTCNSSLGAFHNSLQTADGETPLHPGNSVPSQQQLRCCWLHYQANPILPVHILWEDACLALSPPVLLPYPPARVALDYREICPDVTSGFLNCPKDPILDSNYRVSSESKTYNNSLEWTGTKYIIGG